MIGGVQLAAGRLAQLYRKWGPETIKAAVNHAIEHTEACVREEVSRWPDGRYEATVYVDADTQGTPDVKVQVACIVAGDQLTIDLCGTDARPELVGVWNTFSNSRSYIMTQVVAMMDPTIQKNEGFFNAVNLIIPEGSIAQPPPNKPAALGSFHPACEITEAVCVALSAVVPGRAQPQVYKMGTPNAIIGFDDEGAMWLEQGVDARSCDASAVMGIDGWGSCPNGLGNLLLSQAEDAESRFPIISISREMTTDTEGPGQWRGMPGTLSVKMLLRPAMAMAWMVTQKYPLSGMCGAEPASPYDNHFNVGTPQEYKVSLAENASLGAGAVIAYQYGGGGGFGPALMRDPHAVKEDVLDEYISVTRAREKYGVVLRGSLENYDLAVDVPATEALRTAMAGELAE
jgi:N-methylhydantoinase B